MSTQSDIKLTDQLERELIERELDTPRLGFADDLKHIVAAFQGALLRLQSQARKAKVAFANG